ncbi:MAG: asparagine synthase (glutamine-hydrolyzing) [Pseudomonadota bacterium]
MCGIAGIFGSHAPDRDLLAQMDASLRHRGPDDHDHWVDEDAGIALIHRRLAIVDLSPLGRQPMHSHDGRFVLIFNGEIYNHADIRGELEVEEARNWRGHSDTETFLEAISSWGLAKALERAVGMYAFALWDRKDRKLSLARDRFGEKPLYYGWAGRDLVFASELKAIRRHPKFQAEIDRRALRLFAARTYIPAPFSIYRRVFKLEPGCVLELDARAASTPLEEPPQVGGRAGGLHYWRYWSYRDVIAAGLANPIGSEREAVDELERVLAQAVQGQSMADVPVGAFLSGGIDSSTIVGLYQKYSSQKVRTFTISFKEAAFDEGDYARAVAKHFGTEHHEHVVTPSEAQAVIPSLPQMYDEPFADSSQIPTYLVSQAARQKVTVALSGDGGDELFGGYNRYFGTARLWSRLKHLPHPVRAAAAGTAGFVPAAAWDQVGRIALRGRVPQYFGTKVRKSLRTIVGARGLEDVFASFLDEWADEGSPVIGGEGAADLCSFDLDAGTGAPDALRMMYCDALSYLPDDIMCKVDRASMAVSLETRAPFLDHRVAALAARIPAAMNIQGGGGKHVLKELLFQEAPRALFDRPKAGFGIPVGEWIKGPLRPWAEELLDPALMRHEGWFDADLVLRRWHQHLAGTRDSTPALWAILMFQAWRREQISVEAAAASPEMEQPDLTKGK